MAKKRRNNKKRHQGQDQHQEEFLADAPETNENDWAGDEEQEVQQDESLQTSSNEQDDSLHETHLEDISNEDFLEQEDNPIEATFTLGTFLLNERENKGISLKSVSQSTKISLTNLEFLESDDLCSLPDRAYVMGYVKSYARLLGVDINFCLELLNKTYVAMGEIQRDPEIVIPQAQKSPQIEEQLPIGKIAVIALMGVIIIGIGWFLFNRESGPEKKEEVKVEEKKEEIIQPQTLNAQTPLQDDLPNEVINESEAPKDTTESKETPIAEEKEEAKVENEEVTEVKEEKKVTEVKLEKEIKEQDEDKDSDLEEEKPKRRFSKIITPLYSIDNSISSDDVDDMIEGFRVSPQEGIQAVYISAINADSWLTYKSDNEPIKKFVLRKGRSLLFRAKEARIFLGNLGAVKIFLNNKPLKVTSTSGVKSLVFPQENADKYVTPLFIYEKNGTVQTSDKWIEENQSN